MMAIIDRVIIEKIKSNLTEEINKIANDNGIKDIIIEFDSVKSFTVFLPYLNKKTVSTGIHPDFIKDLQEKGFLIFMLFANNIKGLTLCGKVTKQV